MFSQSGYVVRNAPPIDAIDLTRTRRSRLLPPSSPADRPRDCSPRHPLYVSLLGGGDLLPRLACHTI